MKYKIYFSLTLLWTPMGALTSSVVMGTPSSANSFWKVRTGANTPASHTVPAQSKIHACAGWRIIKALP